MIISDDSELLHRFFDIVVGVFNHRRAESILSLAQGRITHPAVKEEKSDRKNHHDPDADYGIDIVLNKILGLEKRIKNRVFAHFLLLFTVLDIQSKPPATEN